MRRDFISELAVDISARSTYDGGHSSIHRYGLLLGNIKTTNYVETSYCSSHGDTCKSGSKCCCNPAEHSDCAKGGYGICYATDDCSQINTGGDPLKVPAYVYGFSIDDGKQVSKAALCSMEPGPDTNPNQCPWSFQVA